MADDPNVEVTLGAFYAVPTPYNLQLTSMYMHLELAGRR